MARYDIEEGNGYTPNHSVVPALVNAPVILLAPKQRTVSSGELWFFASCTDVNYGGCYVYASNDGVDYRQIGQIDGQSYQGVLTANLPVATGLDETNALSVNMSMSRTVIEGVSQATIDRLDSACYVGGEFVAFRDAALTSLNHYDLTYLQRGVFDSSEGASSGDAFVIIAGPKLRYRFNKLAVGGQLYFKFVGFNIYGGGVQNLADCVEYAYTVTETGGIRALLDDLTLSNFPDIASQTFLGRNTAGTGVTEVLSMATARAMLGITDGQGGALVPVVMGGHADVVTIGDVYLMPKLVTMDDGRLVLMEFN